MDYDTTKQQQKKTKTSTDSSSNRPETSNFRIFLYIMIAFAASTSAINILYHRTTASNHHNENVDHQLRVFTKRKKKHRPKTENRIETKERTDGLSSNPPPPPPPVLKTDETNVHTLAGLSCAKYGGPSDEIADEMVYWSDIPSDSSYISPFKQKQSGLRGVKPVTQYMTFEPDGGGWNNIRMAMETVVVMAHAMGRTLVLPPAQGIYLLRKNRDKHKIHFSFADFFHLESLHLEHAGIDIITTEEFLLREGMTGNLRNKTSGEVVFPPNNRTNWDGDDKGARRLREWMREVMHTPLWDPDDCIAAFPASAGQTDIENFSEKYESMLKEGGRNQDEMIDVDADPISRLDHVKAGRRELCVYDLEMQNAQVLHFMSYHKMRVRLLVHFYAFLFFEDWKQQLWVNRFVRDHLRYIDELQCAAARVVAAIREKAKENGDSEGIFDTFHVRRGDFQYKNVRLESNDLYKQSADLIPANSTLYIATDERDKGFFGPFEEHYHVYYLDDFKHLFEDLNTNYYGMLDQLIASRGRTFIGTYYSTFTGYINRMRGYHSQKHKLEGYENGVINSFYFFPEHRKGEYQRYKRVSQPFFAREFPVSWRDIDKGIGTIH